MSKKRFIQAVLIRNLPPIDKAPAAIAYAENLWDVLTQHGYGDDAPSTPRESVDYYDALNDRQKAWFDRFWNAFGYKKDKNGAAMRWRQLGDPPDAVYKQIVQAAKHEAEQPVPAGQARKYAQGWLHDKRYFDYQPKQEAAQQDPKVLQLRELHSQHQHFKRLLGFRPDDAMLQQQVNDLDGKIKALEGARS